jgi:protein-tyrosine phosphatase
MVTDYVDRSHLVLEIDDSEANPNPVVDFLTIPMGRIDHPNFAFLWIGSKRDAANLDGLRANGISFVVNCTRDHLDGGVKNFHENERGFRYFRLPLKDQESEHISLVGLQDAWKFMKRAREADVNCLVHCSMGKSRSVAVLVSFIMHETGWSYEEALELVKKARYIAEPNPAFADRLRYLHISGDIRLAD